MKISELFTWYKDLPLPPTSLTRLQLDNWIKKHSHFYEKTFIGTEISNCKAKVSNIETDRISAFANYFNNEEYSVFVQISFEINYESKFHSQLISINRDDIVEFCGIVSCISWQNKADYKHSDGFEPFKQQARTCHLIQHNTNERSIYHDEPERLLTIYLDLKSIERSDFKGVFSLKELYRMPPRDNEKKAGGGIAKVIFGLFSLVILFFIITKFNEHGNNAIESRESQSDYPNSSAQNYHTNENSSRNINSQEEETKQTDKEGNRYVGNFDSEGRKDGQGFLTKSDGSRYEGIFDHDVFYSGKVINDKGAENGSLYSGFFDVHKRNGEGILINKTSRYEGLFKDGIFFLAELMKQMNTQIIILVSIIILKEKEAVH